MREALTKPPFGIAYKQRSPGTTACFDKSAFIPDDPLVDIWEKIKNSERI